jgi:hypothetical protein
VVVDPGVTGRCPTVVVGRESEPAAGGKIGREDGDVI